jgi:outer membrane protein TolC
MNNLNTKNLKSRKVLSIAGCLIVLMLLIRIEGIVYSQTEDSLTLQQCYKLAIDYSTIVKQQTIQQQIASANIKTTNAGWIPQASINAQASYQSEVTTIPFSIPIPDLKIPTLAKDQYKGTLDLTQVIYDGGFMYHQKRVYQTGLQVEETKLDVSIQQLKDRINDLYLSLLLINENIRLVDLLKKDITINIETLSAQLANGIVLKSNVEILEAELMKTDQKLIELNETKKSTLEMLAMNLGKTLSDKVILVYPAMEVNTKDTISNRPEYKLFDIQKSNLQQQSILINSKNMPKFLLFADGGYGRPGLNMLSNNFDWFYLAGIKLSMPITNWTSTRHEREAVALQQAIIDANKEDYARNNNIQIVQQLNEMDKYKQLIEKDNLIITKQTEIKDTEAAKLVNGVSTSNDYIIAVNAENQAIRNLKLHEIQLLQAQLNYNSLKGSL